MEDWAQKGWKESAPEMQPMRDAVLETSRILFWGLAALPRHGEEETPYLKGHGT